MDALYFLASLACVLAAAVVLVRTLPAQNVAFIILTLVVVEVAVESWHGNDELFFRAMLWPGVVVFSRMAALPVLKPWRSARKYGYYLITLASCIAALVAMALDSPKAALGRFIQTAVCLIFLTPWYLQKRIMFSGKSKK